MVGDFKRFDMARKPIPQRPYLTFLIWFVSHFVLWTKHGKITRKGMEGITGPFLLLCNHNAFLDLYVMMAAIFPRRANYVISIDGYVGREALLRMVGGICIRKFTNSIQLVRNMLAAKNKGQVVVLFPEARYALCGTQAVLPDSLGKMVRMMNVPVVTLMMHGHHLIHPFWNTRKMRKADRIEAELELMLTAEQTQTLPPDEINALIREKLVYDEFAWQRENKVEVRTPKRAEGLHKVLYQCPHCGTEYRMTSGGDELWCEECGKRWTMSTIGVLSAKEGETEFSHVPDWYEWERENVRREVEAGTYSLNARVQIDSLPNAKRFIPLGAGEMTHDAEGFTLRGTCDGVPFEERWKPLATYSIHIEYDYIKARQRDCVDLSNLVDTFYVFPEGRDFSVTKVALATEELYEKAVRELRASRAPAAV